MKLSSLLAALIAGSFSFAALPSAASTRPAVGLTLNGYVVTSAGGVEKDIPLERTQLRPGDVVKYVIIAANHGSQPARHLIAVGRIPAGTAFAASLTSGSVALVQFSLDGGATWSSTPTTKQHTNSGDVVKKADPASYTRIRFVTEKPLEPSASDTYTYEVRVR